MTYEELVEQAQSRSISMEKARIFATLAVAQAVRDLREELKAHRPIVMHDSALALSQAIELSRAIEMASPPGPTSAVHVEGCEAAVTGLPHNCSCDAI